MKKRGRKLTWIAYDAYHGRMQEFKNKGDALKYKKKESKDKNFAVSIHHGWRSYIGKHYGERKKLRKVI